jgi:hypothetical protein
MFRTFMFGLFRVSRTKITAGFGLFYFMRKIVLRIFALYAQNLRLVSDFSDFRTLQGKMKSDFGLFRTNTSDFGLRIFINAKFRWFDFSFVKPPTLPYNQGGAIIGFEGGGGGGLTYDIACSRSTSL